MRLRVTVICVALVAGLVACGIPKSGGFSDIDRSKIPAPLTATTSTTTTTTTTTTILATTTTVDQPAATTTTMLATTTTLQRFLFPIYFVAGRDQLAALDEPLNQRDPPAAQVMTVLLAGPTDDAQGFRSAIPAGSRPNVREDLAIGTVTVDLDTNFRANSGDDQPLAIGQIVLTLTQVPGISQVTFTENGAPVRVKLPDGSLAEEGAVFHRADYQSLLTTSAATTTTSTTTTTTSPTVDPGISEPPATEPPGTVPAG